MTKSVVVQPNWHSRDRHLKPTAIGTLTQLLSGSAIEALLSNPDRLQIIADNGHRRMGDPGAAQRIAIQLVQQFGKRDA